MELACTLNEKVECETISWENGGRKMKSEDWHFWSKQVVSRIRLLKNSVARCRPSRAASAVPIFSELRIYPVPYPRRYRLVKRRSERCESAGGACFLSKALVQVSGLARPARRPLATGRWRRRELYRVLESCIAQAISRSSAVPTSSDQDC